MSTFLEFAQSDRVWPPNQYVYEPGLTLYVRRSMVAGRSIRGPGIQFDIANVSADYPGKGAFTRFLDLYEPQYGFYMELVHNERLEAYLRRRGYVNHPRCWGRAPNLIKPPKGASDDRTNSETSDLQQGDSTPQKTE